MRLDEVSGGLKSKLKLEETHPRALLYPALVCTAFHLNKKEEFLALVTHYP